MSFTLSDRAAAKLNKANFLNSTGESSALRGRPNSSLLSGQLKRHIAKNSLLWADILPAPGLK